MHSSHAAGMAFCLTLPALLGATTLPGPAAPGALLPAEPLAAAPEFDPNPPFQLDDAGNVYHLDSSYGRIRVNGQLRSWWPDDEHQRFHVTPQGDVIYEDSFGKMRRNGGSYSYNWRREGSWDVDPQGRIVWVKDFTGEEIHRGSWATGYEIAPGSAFDVLHDGTIAWISEDRKLHLDGAEAPLLLQPGLFERDWRGAYWYVVHVNGNRWRLLRHKGGQTQFMAMLRGRHLWKVDVQGRVWYADHAGRIMRGGQDTGLRGFEFRLDRFGRCVHLDGGELHRDGEPLGYRPGGYFDVTRDGDVVWVKDPARGSLYRGPQKLPFRLR